METISFEIEIIPLVKAGWEAFHAGQSSKCPEPLMKTGVPLFPAAWLTGYALAAGLRHKVRQFDMYKAPQQMAKLRAKVDQHNVVIERKRAYAQYEAEAMF